MFKLFPLILTACSDMDISPVRDNLIDKWWNLNGDDFDFNLYLVLNDHLNDAGNLWYTEDEPFLVLNNNELGGQWQLPTTDELEVTLSDSLKELLKRREDVMLVPNTISFSLDLQKNDCYYVELLNLPLEVNGTACSYEGSYRE